MKLHSDTISHSQTLRDALQSIPGGEVVLQKCNPSGSRSRSYAYDVALRGWGARHTRRPNTGARGNRADGYAATYDDWGWWLSALFDIDPDMTTTYYKSRDDFHAQTHGAYKH